MADQDVDLDSIIDRLLEVRGSRPGKQVQLLESEIRYLCTKAREIFISQPILLELEAPIKVCLKRIRCVLRILADDSRFAVIFTVSITIFYVCSNTADSPPRQTISSWEIMSIVASNRLRPSVCC